MNGLKVIGLVKEFRMGDHVLVALKGISFAIEPGEFVAITGQSGCGKSTLMHILGCLDTPTCGDYIIDGINVAHMSRNQQARIRNQKLGFIFQKFHLLPDLTALDNVALPALYAGLSEHAARKKAQELLDMVQLGHRLDHFPYQLSGGQQQRVAIARSLINNPPILLADEPTGNLDSATGKAVMELFKELNRERKCTFVIVTHEPSIAEQAARVIELRDGLIIKDGQNKIFSF